ncbi:MAG: nitroreductase family protein [Candidatus Woesearchaeota archaeon]
MLSQIKNRRSIRKYKPIPVPWSKIIEVVDAARHAPTPGNVQNFSIILVTSCSKIEEIAKLSDQDWILGAPVVLVVCADYNVDYPKSMVEHTVGAVVENMLIEAQNQKLGACWVEAFDKEKLKKLLDIKKSEPVAFITLGFPDEKPKTKHLKPLELFLGYEREGNNKWEYVEYDTTPRLLERIQKRIADFKASIRAFFKKIKK